MKLNVSVNRWKTRTATFVSAAVLFIASTAPSVQAQTVPASIQPPAGSVAFLRGRADGTQNYICLQTPTATAWTFIGPQATLFNRLGGQITTHFLSPNPVEGGTARATWQSSFDTSAVWARAIASSTDPAFVEPNAIPWLLLQVVGSRVGPTGGRTLTRTTFIQRLETSGGVAPSSGCSSEDVGKLAFVPYRATYVFYTERRER